jgi:hypothetical protein
MTRTAGRSPGRETFVPTNDRAPDGRSPAVIWLLLRVSERPKEKPLGRGRKGDKATFSAYVVGVSVQARWGKVQQRGQGNRCAEETIVRRLTGLLPTCFR